MKFSKVFITLFTVAIVGCDKADDVANKAAEATKEVVSGAAETTKEAVSGVAEATKGVASEAVNTVKEGATTMASKVTGEFVTIGTGGVTGVYYPTGGALCRLVNKGKKTHGVRCSVESTGGSVYNINAIRSGELDLGVAQSDWQYHAYNGTSKFANTGAYKDLRAVMSVHPESFTVIARKDSGVTTFDDLKGKRVNVGNPGSGTRATMETLLAAKGWTLSDFKLTSELKSSEQSKALCDNKVDAIAFVVGHPSGSIKEATTSCDTIVVSVAGPSVDNLITKNSYYRTAIIPGGMYSGSDLDVTTFGVGATIVASTAASENAIYQIVKAAVSNIQDFRKLHPAFANLQVNEMAKDALSAPLHVGAAKAFKEAGAL